MNQTLIDWADVSINPIFGCSGPEGKGPCSYCYANNRTRHRMPCPLCREFVVHEHLDRLKQLTPRQKPKRVFMVSCGDMFDPVVKHPWQLAIAAKMRECSQHQFVALTKRHQAVRPEWFDLPNLWLGISVTGDEAEDGDRYDWTMASWPETGRQVVSWEPAWARLPIWRHVWRHDNRPDWLIIGAQSGTGKRLPVRDDIEHAVDIMALWGLPVFCKASIAKLWPDRAWPQEYPPAMTAALAAAKERE